MVFELTNVTITSISRGGSTYPPGTFRNNILVQIRQNYVFVIARPVTDFLSKMDDFPKTHGGSTEPFACEKSLIPIANCDASIQSGGFPPRKKNGNTSTVTDSLSWVGGQGMMFVQLY